MTEIERKFKTNERTCCTCEYWTGQRMPDINTNFVTANSRCKAVCFGKRKPQEKMAQEQYPCYLKINVLLGYIQLDMIILVCITQIAYLLDESKMKN